MFVYIGSNASLGIALWVYKDLLKIQFVGIISVNTEVSNNIFYGGESM